MWYEALPPIVIIYVLLNIPDRFTTLTNKLVLRNVSISYYSITPVDIVFFLYYCVPTINYYLHAENKIMMWDNLKTNLESKINMYV